MSAPLDALTVGRALAAGRQALAATGSATARLDAEVLLAHVLGVDRAWLVAHADDDFGAAAQASFGGLIRRRADGEPVAYLTGWKAWYDLRLWVTPEVLVPRPETEGLLERALAWSRRRRLAGVADIGTGSGALAIGLARALPKAQVYATDVSPAALDVAARNADAAGVSQPIHFLAGDLCAPLPEPVDLIVANLPYIGAQEYEGLMADVRLFEPRQALVGGPRGHELLARLLGEAPRYLNPRGALMAELGPAQARATYRAAHRAFPGAVLRLEHDDAGLLRYLLLYT